MINFDRHLEERARAAGRRLRRDNPEQSAKEDLAASKRVSVLYRDALVNATIALSAVESLCLGLSSKVAIRQECLIRSRLRGTGHHERVYEALRWSLQMLSDSSTTDSHSQIAQQAREIRGNLISKVRTW